MLAAVLHASALKLLGAPSMLTAGVCVLLNAFGTLVMTHSMDWSVLPQSFLSYFAAVATFDHVLR